MATAVDSCWWSYSTFWRLLKAHCVWLGLWMQKLFTEVCNCHSACSAVLFNLVQRSCREKFSFVPSVTLPSRKNCVTVQFDQEVYPIKATTVTGFAWFSSVCHECWGNTRTFKWTGTVPLRTLTHLWMCVISAYKLRSVQQCR